MTSDCPCCGEARPPVEWSRLRVSLDDQQAWWDGRPIRLSGQQLAILHQLARRNGLGSHDALILASQPVDASSINTLQVQICKMRERFADQSVPITIENVHGVGYRLVHEALA